MKKLLIGILLMISSMGFSQNEKTSDSLKLRVFNDGKYYIKELKVKVDGNEYVFKNVWKKKYSDYISLPYLWSYSNSLTTTVIVKKMFRYDEWHTLTEFPIDHIGEKKIENGHFTLSIKTKMKKKQLTVERNLVKE